MPSLMESMLNGLRINKNNRDREDEEEYYDEEDTSYDDDEVGSRFIPGRDDDDDEEEESPKIRSFSRTSRASNPNKISSIRSTGRTRRTIMEICVVRPHDVNEAEEITKRLVEGSCVILNLEGIELEVLTPIFFYACGSCKAVNGNLEILSATDHIYLFTPENVEINSDQIATLESAFM